MNKYYYAVVHSGNKSLLQDQARLPIYRTRQPAEKKAIHFEDFTVERIKQGDVAALITKAIDKRLVVKPPKKIRKSEFPIINRLIGRSIVLCDIGTRDHYTVKAYRAIDISSICVNAKQCLVKYAYVQRNIIAQVVNLHEKGGDLGMNIHYNINEYRIEQLAKEESFVQFAKMIGANPSILSRTIFDNK